MDLITAALAISLFSQNLNFTKLKSGQISYPSPTGGTLSETYPNDKNESKHSHKVTELFEKRTSDHHNGSLGELALSVKTFSQLASPCYTKTSTNSKKCARKKGKWRTRRKVGSVWRVNAVLLGS
jgi:hypothetical protein